MQNSTDLTWINNTAPGFDDPAAHRQWLLAQAFALLEFFQPAAFNPKGGFFGLDGFGQPVLAGTGPAGVVRNLHDTTRMVHSYAIGHGLDHPGAEQVIDHGMDFLWNRHRDHKNGGFFNAVDDDGPTDATKQAYSHAFVLLAASSAKVAGHPDADRLLSDITAILHERFWDTGFGATREEFAADWGQISDYRGQNSNMHLTEALMAAYEVTAETEYLAMARRIAELIINRHANELDWRVAEHFNTDWQVDRHYQGDPMFRPRGTTPGHSLEWSRLLIQLWELDGRKHSWMKSAAVNLFRKATENGWDAASGGFFYTLDWKDKPDVTDKLWWPCAEGIAAASVLASVDDSPEFSQWYRRIWAYSDHHFIDKTNGGWWPVTNAGADVADRIFTGKPDIYHALQACLIPLLPTACSITSGLQKFPLAGDGNSGSAPDPRP